MTRRVTCYEYYVLIVYLQAKARGSSSLWDLMSLTHARKGGHDNRGWNECS